MKPYIGIVHQDEGSAYGITFPDAPGCFSAADSLDEIFAKAEEALGLWLDVMTDDGTAAPVTSDLSDIECEPRWTEAFADTLIIVSL